MSRASKRRRQERRERVETVARPAPPPANRGTFRVAQANRQLADALPGVVRNRQAERAASAKPRRQLSIAEPVTKLVQGEAKRSPRREPVRNTPAPLNTRDNIKGNCVRRPDGGPKNKGGSGRAFVPFCK